MTRRRRYVHERDRAAADELLGDVRGDLALEEADIEMLKAISRGENVARADLALAAIRLRLEWSAPRPSVAVDLGTTVFVLNPFDLPPTPPRPALPPGPVIEGELVAAP
jgi:hypothetical protein